MTDIQKQQFLSELQQFHCTTQYYQHPFYIVFTDGVKFVADKCGAFWLLDLISSWQSDPKVAKESFQVFKLKVNPDQSARVTIEDGNDNIIAYQDIEYTDFPIEEMIIWCIDHVVLLPGEY